MDETRTPMDRLFDRLIATYGREFLDKWGVTPLPDVKAHWARELAAFATPQGLRSIAWALENLPVRAPNVVEFRALVRQAPGAPVQRLPEPKADPERVRKVQEELDRARRELTSGGDRGRPEKLVEDFERRVQAGYRPSAAVREAMSVIASRLPPPDNPPDEVRP